jgi:hypothetical protein
VLEFTPTIEDRVALALWRLERTGLLKRTLTLLWWTGFVMGAIASVSATAVFVLVSRHVSLLALLPAVMGPVGWLVLTAAWPGLTRAWATRRLAGAAKRKMRDAKESTIRVWLDDTGLTVAIVGGATSRYAWTALPDVGETQEHVFIMINRRAGVALPRRLDPAMVAGFADQVRAHLGPPPSPSPSVPAATPQPIAVAPPGDSTARPNVWVAASGVVPLSGFAPGSAMTNPVTPVIAALNYTVKTEDLVAAVLDNPATRKRYEDQVWRAGWRRSLRTLPITLGLVLLANLFMFDLGVEWSVLSTVLLGGLFAVVQWSQIDHTIKRRLPAALEKQSLHDLAHRGDQRRVVAEPAGLTLVDAAATGRFGWHQVQLTETDRYVIVTAHLTSWAIPKRLGQPLASFVQFARSHGVS